jgi:hypothetical protein
MGFVFSRYVMIKGEGEAQHSNPYRVRQHTAPASATATSSTPVVALNGSLAVHESPSARASAASVQPQQLPAAGGSTGSLFHSKSTNNFVGGASVPFVPRTPHASSPTPPPPSSSSASASAAAPPLTTLNTGLTIGGAAAAATTSLRTSSAMAAAAFAASGSSSSSAAPATSAPTGSNAQAQSQGLGTGVLPLANGSSGLGSFEPESIEDDEDLQRRTQHATQALLQAQAAAQALAQAQAQAKEARREARLAQAQANAPRRTKHLEIEIKTPNGEVLGREDLERIATAYLEGVEIRKMGHEEKRKAALAKAGFRVSGGASPAPATPLLPASSPATAVSTSALPAGSAPLQGAASSAASAASAGSNQLSGATAAAAKAEAAAAVIVRQVNSRDARRPTQSVAPPPPF